MNKGPKDDVAGEYPSIGILDWHKKNNLLVNGEPPNMFVIWLVFRCDKMSFNVFA